MGALGKIQLDLAKYWKFRFTGSEVMMRQFRMFIRLTSISLG